MSKSVDAQKKKFKAVIRIIYKTICGDIDDNESIDSELLGDLSRGLYYVFNIDHEHDALKIWSAGNYSTINSAADYLWDEGFRVPTDLQ